MPWSRGAGVALGPLRHAAEKAAIATSRIELLCTVQLCSRVQAALAESLGLTEGIPPEHIG